MVNFWEVGANALWILGLSLLLATFSMAHYTAHSNDTTFGQVLKSTGYELSITISLVLFCAGIAATDDRWWARIIWIALGIAALAGYIVKRSNPKRN